MIDRINALGQFLVNQTGKTFNFKSIKSDHMYPGILFSFAGEDYLVTPDKAELDLTIVINLVSLAMKNDLHYSILRDFIFTHPSMSEGLNDLFKAF